MIRAAVIPLYAGYAGLVVADCSTTPARVLRARTLAVGALVPLDEPAGKLTHRREVDDAACEDVAARIVPELQALRVERVVVERQERPISRSHEPGARIDAAARIVDAITSGCERAGIEVETCGTSWRQKTSVDRIGDALAAGLVDWPADMPWRAARFAGALLLATLGAGPVRRHALAAAERRELAKAAEAKRAAELAASAERAPVAPVAPAPHAVPAPDLTLPLVPLGPRVAGLDPGSAHVGLVIGEGSAAPLRCLIARTIDVGERVALARPRTGTRPDGTTYTTTHRHTVTAEHVDACASAVVAELVRAGVTRLAIEHADTVRMDPKHAAAHSSIATAMARQAWIAGVIGERARVLGIDVLRVGASTWRGAVAGRGQRGGDGAERIPAAIAAGYVGWTAGDEHALDAAGVVLWLVRPAEPAPRAPRAVAPAGVPAPARTRQVGDGARARSAAKERTNTAARAAERRAAGCACTSPRHARACPLFVAKLYRTREEAR